MKIIYTSTLGCPQTINNKLITAKLRNANCFIDTLKQALKQTKQIMFITNRWQTNTPLDQPKDEVFNDYHYTNKEYANTLKSCLELSGIKFEKIVVVDCEYQGDFKLDCLSSDLIFIQSGHTPRGLKILKDLSFEKIIKEFAGVLLMTGTSAKLPANKVLSTHHGNMKEYEIEEGLCLKTYSIRPHFKYSFKMRFDKKFRARVSLIKDFSKNIDVYAIDNDSYIFDDNGNVVVYGNCHLFKNGKIKKICSDNHNIKLKL